MQTQFLGVLISHPGHASFIIEANGKTVYVDPFVIPPIPKKADLILVTHGHHDHFSDISKIRGPSTPIIGPRSCLGVTQHISAGDTIDFGWTQVEAVPAYNLGKRFHLKGDGVGFILSLSKTRIYHAGDTDNIPELSAIKADVALLPIGGTYTMDVPEAIEAALRIKPKLAIPMHYNHLPDTPADPRAFKKEVEEKSRGAIEVRII